MWRRKAVEQVEHRGAQLMKPGEGQLHLRLNPRGVGHSAVRCLPDQVLQERRFAYTRFTPQYECPALADPNSLDELIERLTFAAPVSQHRATPSPGPAFVAPSGEYP
ncbi:hypothetical protein GCM10010464_12220 [Pseudonocardia yunnanensis]